jgi:hypothetical protein
MAAPEIRSAREPVDRLMPIGLAEQRSGQKNIAETKKSLKKADSNIEEIETAYARLELTNAKELPDKP